MHFYLSCERGADVVSYAQGTLLRASQFLAAELPIRLAHRVKELDELPQGLHKMPSIEKVKRWYAQSFEASRQADETRLDWPSADHPPRIQELVNFPRPELPEDLQDALLRASQESESIPDPVPNPSLPEHMKPRANQLKSKQGRQKIPLHRCVLTDTLGSGARHSMLTRKLGAGARSAGITRSRTKRSCGRQKYTITTIASRACCPTSSGVMIPS